MTGSDKDLMPGNRELLDAFRQGSSAAFRSIYLHYAHEIHTLLRNGFLFKSGEKTYRFRGYRNLLDAQDKVQEIFEKAFSESARLSYDGLRPFSAYVATIARNMAVYEFRKKDALFEAVDAAADLAGLADGDGLSERQPTADENLEMKELLRLVEEFAAGLPPDRKRVYEERCREGKTLAETAAAAGLTMHKVRKQEKAIRKGFLKYMKARGYCEFISYHGIRKPILVILGL